MDPKSFQTDIVNIPEYCGGTTCLVISMKDREQAKVYQHVMTETGVYRVMPDGLEKTYLEKTCLDREIDQALHLRIEGVPRGRMTILSGPSASGKSSLARKMVQEDGHCVRINRDDLRNMAIVNWDGRRERFIVDAEKAIAKAAQVRGHNVVIDDTNLTDGHIQMWKDYGKEAGFKTITVQPVVAELEECVARDKIRVNPRARVGRAVIERQFLKGKLINWGTKPVVMCDLDGTMCNIDHRLYLIDSVCPDCKGEPLPASMGISEAGDIPTCALCKGTGKQKKDWRKFEAACRFDSPVEAIVKWVRALATDHTVVLVSGRQIVNAQAETLAWLEQEGAPYDHIFMRQSRDSRKDTEIKQEILDQMLESGLPKEQIKFVIDDRQQVVDMWRLNGIRVIPVRCSDREF